MMLYICLRRGNHKAQSGQIVVPFIIVLILLLALPFAEIAVFIAVGEELGILRTLALMILSAIGGVFIVRHQGVGHLQRLRENIRSGQPPVEDLLHTTMLVFAGICLIIPGFITDAIGIVLLIPPLRAAAARWFLDSLPRGHWRTETRVTIIEGEAWEHEDGPEPPDALDRPRRDPRDDQS